MSDYGSGQFGYLIASGCQLRVRHGCPGLLLFPLHGPHLRPKSQQFSISFLSIFEMLIVWNIFFCGANGSKVVDVIQHPDRKIEGPEDSDQTVSKEEEERYRKLLQENEQLQQLIAAREHKLKLLNQRLLERDANAGNANGGVGNAAPTTNATTNAVTTVHPPPVKKNRYSTISGPIFISGPILKYDRLTVKCRGTSRRGQT